MKPHVCEAAHLVATTGRGLSAEADEDVPLGFTAETGKEKHALQNSRRHG